MSQLLRKLRKALGEIDRPGSFYAAGQEAAVPPGLEAKGLGPVALPLTAAQAKGLKKLCEQAPYGQGERTLVDTKVRKVWRLKPDKFKLANPEWKRFLDGVVRQVGEDLGLEQQKVQAHLYELLLYEKGSFFLPHKDGEKLERMVATLVVVLPSSFEGGALVVRHEGEEAVLDFGGGQDPYHHHWAAFYADCEHEVRPLALGYRLCLVYNLTLAKGKKALAAPTLAPHVQAVEGVLREWAEKGEGKLVYTLEHKYTPKGLTWDALKGVDRARARALTEAAQRADCLAYLGLLTFHESGSAVEGYDDYDGGGWYDEDEDEDYDDGDDYDEGEEDDRENDDEDDGDGEGEYEMEEVFDSSLTGEDFLDPAGGRPGFESLAVGEEELVDPGRLRSVKPKEEYEGYTGNEGMTLDRWYRHGAVFIWPRARQFDVMCDTGTAAAVGLFADMVERLGQSKRGAEGLRGDCVTFAGRIIDAWRPYYDDDTGPGEQPHRFFKALAELDDLPLVIRYLKEVMTKDETEEPGAALAAVCRRHGVGPLREALAAVFRVAAGDDEGFNSQDKLERDVRALERVCVARGAEDRDDCRDVAGVVIGALDRVDRQRARWLREDEADDDRFYFEPEEERDSPEPLAGLVRALVAVGDDELLGRLVGHVAARPLLYPLRTCLVPAVQALGPWLGKNLDKPLPALNRWLASVRGALEQATAHKPEAPTDFRRPAPLKCKCEDCRALKKYLEDPRAVEGRFPAPEHRRRHLEIVTRRRRLDLDYRTEKRGRPHTLVCTKTTRSFEEALRTFRQDEGRLAVVRKIEAAVARKK